MLKLEMSVEPVPLTNEYVFVLVSPESVALSVPTTALVPAFSAMLVADKVMLVGAEFAAYASYGLINDVTVSKTVSITIVIHAAIHFRNPLDMVFMLFCIFIPPILFMYSIDTYLNNNSVSQH